jgi:hypothetical protein
MKWRAVAKSTITRGAVIGYIIGFAFGYAAGIAEGEARPILSATRAGGLFLWFGIIGAILVRSASKPEPVAPDTPEADYSDRDP